MSIKKEEVDVKEDASKVQFFSPSVVLIAALLFALFYVVVVSNATSILPEKWLRDTNKIYAIMDNDNFGSNSFAATAFFYSLFPDILLPFFVQLIGVISIFMFLKETRTFRTLFLIVPILLPMLLLCALAPTKDLLVVIMTIILVAMSGKRYANDKVFSAIFIAILVMYGAYAALVRSYYGLIIGTFIFIQIVTMCKPKLRYIILSISVVALFIVPPHIFYLIQGQRDRANSFAVLVGSNNRTAFNNMLPPINAVNFLVNYAYAFVRLNFSYLFNRSANDLYMIVWTGVISYTIYWRLALLGKYRNESFQRNLIFLKLFLAHVIVSIVFEPDIGSYLRHLSAATLLLVPSIIRLDDSHYALIRRGRGTLKPPRVRRRFKIGEGDDK